MSNEVFQLMKQLDTDTVDMQIVLQCAPVLTGLKVSNLLNIKSIQGKDVGINVNKKDISVYILADNGYKMSVLLYREKELKKYLSDEKVVKMLYGMGYESNDLMKLLSDFAKRYRDYLDGFIDFPHEMGLFLGYPLEDVKGFIDNKGKNFLCSGYWKVYANMPEKIELFKKFQQAEEILMRNLYFERMYHSNTARREGYR